MAVVRNDPGREEAWKRLGYRKFAGAWRSEVQIAAIKTETDAQARADRTWKPKLERWRNWLNQPRLRASAEKELATVSDPLAVPSVVQVFGLTDQPRAVQLLGQIDSPRSSRTLAMLAVWGLNEEVRTSATQTLRNRDPREYADLLIRFLRDPIAYRVEPVNGPGSAGILRIEDEKADIIRRYAAPAAPGIEPGDRLVGYDEFGLPIVARGVGMYQTPWFRAGDLFPNWNGIGSPFPQGSPSSPAMVTQLAGIGVGKEGTQALAKLGNSGLLDWGGGPNSLPASYRWLVTQGIKNWTWVSARTPLRFTIQRDAVLSIGQQQIEATRAAMSAQQQLEQDVAALESYNALAQYLHDRVVPVLNQAAGGEVEGGCRGWENWWIDQLGFPQPQRYEFRPTVLVDVPPTYVPQPTPIGFRDTPISFQRRSCFGAGTPVHTRAGLRPIEQVCVGDEVLTQDAQTGSLSYQPVLIVHHNPPSITLRVQLDQDTVVASTFHRFWIAGAGWKMARDLKPGDVLRTLGGTATVLQVDPGEVQRVYNLDVAESHSFFVGRRGALVHDNSIPGTRLTPFDALATAE